MNKASNTLYLSDFIHVEGNIPVKVIIIDDDLDFLYKLKTRFNEYDKIEIIGLFQNLYLAKKLKERHPSIQIIFVTQHEEFALDAFKLHTLDYILKLVPRRKT